MIFAKNFAKNYEKKNNAWNIRRLVDESFIPHCNPVQGSTGF